MKLRDLELLWPYGPDSPRRIDQLDVVVDLDDGSRWSCAFHDTQRYNQGGQGMRGLGEAQRFRLGPRLVIVEGLTEASVREAVLALIEDGRFEQVFERVGAPD